MRGLYLIPLLAGLALADKSCNTSATSTSDADNAKFLSGTTGIRTLTANTTNSVIIIDYGHEVEGIPSFEVLSREGDTSHFEISYAESLAAFDTYMSDGPLPLAAAMDTYRINRYNISSAGVVKNRLVQGGFRYQKLNLTSPGSLSVRSVGVWPTTDTTPIDELPGSFTSSNEMVNRIWKAGALTLKLTEIPKDSIPDFYVVTPEGAIAESQAPQVLGSATAAQLLTYEMAFEVKPVRGGFGFMVLSDTQNNGIYLSCDIAEGTLAAYFGSTTFNTLINSTSLPANLTLMLDTWHSVRVNVETAAISVTINDSPVMTFSQQDSFFGSFGFGASFDQKAIFRDLNVTTLGQTVYSHSLKDSSFLSDFFSGTNPADTVVDGSRRDRIAYTGDLDIAGGAALASTHGLDYILGSLDLLGSYQTTPGFFIPTAKIQQDPLPSPLNVSVTGLIGYSFNFLNAVANTYMHTGNVSFAKQWSSHVQSMLDWADSQTLDNGLFNLSQASFGGDWNYYDPPQAGVVTKFNVIYAYALQECRLLLADAGVNTTAYERRLAKLRTAIDENLWDDGLGAYYLSDSISDGFAQDANAIAILAGVNVNPEHSTEKILASLETLMTPFGPLAFSSEVISDQGFQSYISPYASSYHLRAALASNASESALKLLSSLWEPMTNISNANYTGTFWETLNSDGKPALGTITSLCHGWAAGPTAEISKYILGAMPSAPGWKSFTVAPQTLGLRSAAGKLPLTDGTVSIEWQFGDDDMLTMSVEAPSHLNGTVSLPRPLLVASSETVFVVNGSEQGGPFNLEDGRLVIQQKRR